MGGRLGAMALLQRGGAQGTADMVVPCLPPPLCWLRAHQAWQQLFPAAAAPPPRSIETLRLLGLNLQPVIGALQRQPSALHCDKYQWRGGERPPVPPLDESVRPATTAPRLGVSRAGPE